MVPCAFQRPRERGANLRAVSSPFEVWIWIPDYAIMGSTGPALPAYKLALVLLFHTQQDKTWGVGASAPHIRSTCKSNYNATSTNFEYHRNMLLQHKSVLF